MIVVDRLGNEITNGASQNSLLKKLYGTFLGRCALKILVCKFVSDIGGWYMNSGLSKGKIAPFIASNKIDMNQYEEQTYKSYNDFFTRKIKPGKRAFSANEAILSSPADAKLSSYQINEESRFLVKDTWYSIGELLDDEKLGKRFLGGYCLIFRLTVDDYHRYSFIDDGKVIASKYIKGKFHTVNPIANDYYPIYKQNSRNWTQIESKHFGTMMQIEVGAMMVGKIVNHDVTNCMRGQEKGYFEFGGSTVIILLEKGQVKIDQDIIENTKNDKETVVKLGETIGIKD